MNLIDVLLLIIILISIYSGYQKGFILGTLDLLSLAAALIFALWSSRYIARFLKTSNISLGVWTLPLAFILGYIFARILLGFLTRKGLQEISPRTSEGTFNKTFGVLPGFINGLITVAIISALLLAMPMFDGLSARTRDSSIANALTPHLKWAEDLAKREGFL